MSTIKRSVFVGIPVITGVTAYYHYDILSHKFNVLNVKLYPLSNVSNNIDNIWQNNTNNNNNDYNKIYITSFNNEYSINIHRNNCINNQTSLL